MLRTLRRVSTTYVAYVLLLLAFVALGTFVYALATDSALAGITGGTGMSRWRRRSPPSRSNQRD
jgi:hypothetical protein